VIAIVIVIAMACTSARAQSDAGSEAPQNETSAGDQSQDSTQQPATQQPASDQAAADQQIPPYRRNPLLIGFNLPQPVPPGAENRSFLIPGAQISEGIYADQRDGFGNDNVYGTTRAFGSLSLQKLWSNYDFGLDYVGGAAYIGDRTENQAFLQSLDVDQHISWSKGEFAIRDSFSYLPEGNFGAGSFGGSVPLSSLGAGLAGGLLGLGIFGAGQFASLGEQPRITNVALADVTQYLTDKTAVSAAGSYGLVHFTGGDFGLINSHQAVGQVGYNHLLNRRDQVAVIYAFQELVYPSTIGNNIRTNLVNVLFGHRLSERLQFIVGAGPQFTHTISPVLGTINTTTVSGRASLEYQYRSTEVGLRFFRYNTNGSGFFAGATTDVLRFSVNRPFARIWGAEVDVGYAHDRAISPAFATSARTYSYVYAGGGLHRQMGREFSAFISYQFGNLSFDQEFCLNTSCGRLSQREVALIGLDWHPHPIRLD
jgi:hypothetical protein